MADFSFNPEGIEPAKPFEVLPKGKYLAEVKSSDVKTNKKGTGRYLDLQIQVLDGEHKGRIVFDKINFQNENKQAEEIAQRQLAALCLAVGLKSGIKRASEELHGIPFVATVDIEPAKGEYSAKNIVKGYEPASGGVAPKATTAQAPKSSTPPWKR